MLPSSTATTATTAATAIATKSATFSQIQNLITALTTATKSSSSISSIRNILLSTSPTIYFIALIVAGCGVPISEDALCIFVGSVLPSIWVSNPLLRNQLIAALYFGVVVSDVVTFSIGRVMKEGLLEPVRKKLGVRSDRIDFCEDDENDEDDNEYEEEEEEDDFDEAELDALELSLDQETDLPPLTEEFCEIPTTELRSKDKVIAILESVGDYAGLVIRLSVGMRLPMMLATGFSGKVPYTKYILGTACGACISLGVQLLFGFLLRNNPALIIASVACISTFPLVIPSMVAFLSWVNVLYKRWGMYNTGRRASASASASAGASAGSKEVSSS